MTSNFGYCITELDDIVEEEEDVFTVMVMKSCRIGNYKSALPRDTITVSSNGLRFNVLSPDTGNLLHLILLLE